MTKSNTTGRRKVPQKKSSINKHVEILNNANQLVDEAKAKAESVTKEIREGFHDVVVVFIDLVDSTKFKVEFKEEPEKWILRLVQFSEFLTKLIEEANGKVVKYIGDEVMAIFDQETMVNDTLNLLNRIDDIQQHLTNITNHDTKVKIAVDKGEVYLVKYTGHQELDPQGTPVDRCARIAKYAQPGTVVTSFEYQKFIGKRTITHEVGNIDLKGIGITSIYQLYEQTIKIEENIEVNKSKYLKLLKEQELLQAENSELVKMNRSLQHDIKQLGVTPSEDNSIIEEEDTETALLSWDRDIHPLITRLGDVINKARVSSNDYGRFLFLYFKDNLAQKYNLIEGKTFDACIDSNLVIESENDGWYILNKDHKLNKQAIKAMNELEPYLLNWQHEYPDDVDFEDYDCSLLEPGFWKNWLHIDVM
ncbi:adenylate/guanylate cyclase domain-containing protein [Priestia megaterium]|uniref:adenylate/guanylate cyclase domain-containing protein n=1 Tax=Priestia megaterium TaxID=1404 RepID=UPI0021AC4668|nr:adenylate/guanylate cyclase domain-containing protein [Priestia megaterium]MCR8927456.1 adenylate/guanylate cyclase domain-containing protein [Priestia megaterium]